MKRATNYIDTVASVQELSTGERANNATRALPIEEVNADVAGIWARAMVADHDQAVVAPLQAAYSTVRKVTAELESLRKDVDRWQRLESELAFLDRILLVDPDPITESWPHVRQMIGDLTAGAEWAQPLEHEVAALEAAQNREKAADVQHHFRGIRHFVTRRFYLVNWRIKALCDELRVIGDPVVTVATSSQ